MKKFIFILFTMLLFSFVRKQPETIVVCSREDLSESCITFNLIKPHDMIVSKIQITLGAQSFVIESIKWRESLKIEELVFEIPLCKGQHLLAPIIIFYSGKTIFKTMRVHDDFVGGGTQLYSFYK